jgi:hypothetical protein
MWMLNEMHGGNSGSFKIAPAPIAPRNVAVSDGAEGRTQSAAMSMMAAGTKPAGAPMVTPEKSKPRWS